MQTTIVNRGQRRGVVVWFTGLSSAGKTTLAVEVLKRLSERGYRVEHLDGDAVRQSLSKDLGFSKNDRDENIRRIGARADALIDQGAVVLVSAISPSIATRGEVRARIGQGFIEVFVNAPLEVCEKRDVKGLYKKAREGAIRDFTGLDAPYEPPSHPEVECRTDLERVEACAAKVMQAVMPRLESGVTAAQAR